MASRSNFGGYWGAELKFAGYDAVIVQGKAPKPVYINIVDDKVTIEDAKNVWGQDGLAAQETIKNELNDRDTQIATIGPAGERMVRIAPIIHRLGNVARQGGFGAVMGSKNLKAIAVRGTNGVKVADKKGLIEYVKVIRSFQPAPLGATPLSNGPPELDREAHRSRGHQPSGPALQPDREQRALAAEVPPQDPVLLLLSPGLLHLHENSQAGAWAQ